MYECLGPAAFIYAASPNCSQAAAKSGEDGFHLVHFLRLFRERGGTRPYPTKFNPMKNRKPHAKGAKDAKIKGRLGSKAPGKILLHPSVALLFACFLCSLL